MNKYNGSELFGMHYNIFPVCCCCIRPTYIVAVRQVTMSFTLSSCATVRDKKGTTKSVCIDKDLDMLLGVGGL